MDVPGKSQYVPAGHWRHVEEEVASHAVEYLPTGQYSCIETCAVHTDNYWSCMCQRINRNSKGGARAQTRGANTCLPEHTFLCHLCTCREGTLCTLTQRNRGNKPRAGTPSTRTKAFTFTNMSTHNGDMRYRRFCCCGPGNTKTQTHARFRHWYVTLTLRAAYPQVQGADLSTATRRARACASKIVPIRARPHHVVRYAITNARPHRLDLSSDCGDTTKVQPGNNSASRQAEGGACAVCSAYPAN